MLCRVATTEGIDTTGKSKETGCGCAVIMERGSRSVGTLGFISARTLVRLKVLDVQNPSTTQFSSNLLASLIGNSSI
jgi:hypothetical protein